MVGRPTGGRGRREDARAYALVAPASAAAASRRETFRVTRRRRRRPAGTIAIQPRKRRKASSSSTARSGRVAPGRRGDTSGDVRLKADYRVELSSAVECVQTCDDLLRLLSATTDAVQSRAAEPLDQRGQRPIQSGSAAGAAQPSSQARTHTPMNCAANNEVAGHVSLLDVAGSQSSWSRWAGTLSEAT